MQQDYEPVDSHGPGAQTADMRQWLAAAAVAGLIFGSSRLVARPAPYAAPAPQAASRFTLHFAPRIPLDQVYVSWYSKTWRRASSGLHVLPPGYRYLQGLEIVGDHDLAFSTTEGPTSGASAAPDVKIVIYVAGYRLAFVDVPSTALTQSATVALEPLGTVPLNGRIPTTLVTERTDRVVDVGFDASSIEEGYFSEGEPDHGWRGFHGSVPAAEAPVRPDGSFAANIPDFASDPAVARWKGCLQFTIGPTGQRLTTGDDSIGLFALGVTASYPTEVLLRLADFK